jgi:glycosyltransferase involved in cell wall biosynthesis
MQIEPLVSIIINNYNYEQFLAEAIDSALAQTYSKIEVIVVDDGSTDNSRNIIDCYDSQIIPVLRSNAGQSSSLNEGFKVSKGEIIFFLDADDIFAREKVEKIVELFRKNNLIGLPIICSNAFEAVDEKGIIIENITPSTMFSDWSTLAKIRGDHYTGGDHYFFNGEINEVCTPDQVYKFASKYRHIPYIGMTTSNIAMSRTLACKVFPMPINNFKTCADSIMGRAASLLGSVYSTNLILTQYRIHGTNAWFSKETTRELEESVLILPDEYLNLKLIEMGKKPVFSFFKSMFACGFYRHWLGYNSANHLIKLAFHVIIYRVDFETFVFFINNFTRGVYYKLKLFQMYVNTMNRQK